MKKFEKKLKKKGLLIVNTTLATSSVNRNDLEIINIPATEMASEMDNIQVANMIVLGAYVSRLKIFPIEAVIEELKNIIPSRRRLLLPINEKALIRGAEFLKRK
jgi:2-oxoglutarate ferredoxin oxidoreductase subunit gamma